MRLFAAIQLPDDARRHLRGVTGEIAEDLDPRSKLCNWVARDNYHLTLKFLGDADDAQIPSLRQLLQEQCSAAPFVLRAGEAIFIPSAAKVRVVAVEVLGDVERASSLAKALNAACATLGFPRDDRPWLPHITIGRPHHRLASRSMPATEIGPAFVVESFALMSSELRSTGPVYSVIAKFPFTERLEK